MQLAAQVFLLLVQCILVQCGCRTVLQMRCHHAPQFAQETVGAFHARVRPLQRLLRRRSEHHEQAHGIGTVLVDDHLRIDAVVFRLRHLAHAIPQYGLAIAFQGEFHRLALVVGFHRHIGRREPVLAAFLIFAIETVCQHHALTQQALEWFIAFHQTEIPHQLVEEAGVQQVQNGVLDTADILVHRQPVVGGFRVQHFVIGAGAAETGVIPGRFHEGIEGIGFALGGFTLIGRFAPFGIGLDG